MGTKNISKQKISIDYGYKKVTKKYRKFLDKTLVLSIICKTFSISDEKIIKEEGSIEILKVLGLIYNTNE